MRVSSWRMPFYTFLAKKVAIPNSTRLKHIAWNPEHGWLVCGGDEGLLKVGALAVLERVLLEWLERLVLGWMAAAQTSSVL